jgi:hypothetical protein
MKPNNHPARVALRKSEAKARQEASNKLSPKQRLENLDIKFGAGEGAKKERAKLVTVAAKPAPQKAASTTTVIAKKYEELETSSLPDEVLQEIAALNDEANSKKKLKAKDRRAKLHTNND